jgi:ectoine hydroxylase-related dioxygenase (phytanoyl-CoA dioxygenase family)
MNKMVSIEQLKKTLKEEGYVILRKSFAPEKIKDEICKMSGCKTYEELKDVFEDEDLALGESRTNFRITGPCEGCVLSNQFRELLTELGQWSWYDASIITAIPGKGRQPAHRDYAAPKNNTGRWKIVTFSPMNDVKLNGGVTVVFPTTHLGSPCGHSKRIRLDAGDELVFFSSLYHYGAANKSQEYRVMFSQTYDVIMKN